MKRLLTPAFVSLLLLAACDGQSNAPAPASATDQKTAAAPLATTPGPATETAVNGFTHDPNLDLTGFYFTETMVKSGNWQLESLSIGGPSDFADWEAGKRSETYGPIFLHFEDVTSPTAENELGQTYHKVSFRLLPGSYAVDTKELTFRAKDPRVGDVTLWLVPDLAALEAARKAGPNGGPARIVLTGSLEINGERIRNISFIYHPGE